MRRWIAGFLAAFSLGAAPVLACSCDGPSPNACQPPAADVIALARVIAIEQNPFLPGHSATGLALGDRPAPAYRPVAPLRPQPWGSVRVTLRVTERLHGDAADSLVVRTELSSEACGYPFVLGREYLVFASRFQGNLIVNSCSRTQPAKVAASRIRQLRALRDQIPLPDLFGFVGTHPDRAVENPAETADPMPGLNVTAHSDSGDYHTQTGVDGAYEFHGVPTGRYQLSVEAPAGRRALWGGAARVGANAGPVITCPIDFEVFWDGRITGTVTSRDGQPVSGFITARYLGPEPLQLAAVTNSVRNGRFEILWLRPGPYRLQFHANTRPPAPPIDYPTPVDVGEGVHVDGLQFTVF